MIRRPTGSKRTDTRVPYTTRFRSGVRRRDRVLRRSPLPAGRQQALRWLAAAWLHVAAPAPPGTGRSREPQEHLVRVSGVRRGGRGHRWRGRTGRRAGWPAVQDGLAAEAVLLSPARGGPVDHLP